MNRTPSLARIIQVDYLAQVGVATPLVGWAVVLIFVLWPPNEVAVAFRDIALAATLIGLTLLAWRWWLIRSTYNAGYSAEGVISGVWFYRNRGRIRYEYEVQGRKYAVGNAVSYGRRTRDLKPGQRVNVTYHRASPERAFVDELYL